MYICLYARNFSVSMWLHARLLQMLFVRVCVRACVHVCVHVYVGVCTFTDAVLRVWTWVCVCDVSLCVWCPTVIMLFLHNIPSDKVKKNNTPTHQNVLSYKDNQLMQYTHGRRPEANSLTLHKNGSAMIWTDPPAVLKCHAPDTPNPPIR